mmetsp:Transcript_22234/g.69592  ORF Transcript_22234/g.69592 Transcript_22234/m.69592 type:complete len:263 (-) Transcript_22234:997-1785(-)
MDGNFHRAGEGRRRDNPAQAPRAPVDLARGRVQPRVDDLLKRCHRRRRCLLLLRRGALGLSQLARYRLRGDLSRHWRSRLDGHARLGDRLHRRVQRDPARRQARLRRRLRACLLGSERVDCCCRRSPKLPSAVSTLHLALALSPSRPPNATGGWTETTASPFRDRCPPCDRAAADGAPSRRRPPPPDRLLLPRKTRLSPRKEMKKPPPRSSPVFPRQVFWMRSTATPSFDPQDPRAACSALHCSGSQTNSRETTPVVALCVS